MPAAPESQEHRQDQLLRQWRILIELSRHPDGLRLSQLVKTIGMRDRTIRRDVATLTGAGFRISRTRLRGRAVFQLAQLPTLPIAFDHDELAALALASHMVLSFPGSPFYGAMTRAIKKIQGLARADEADAFDMSSIRLWAGVRRARRYAGSEIWFKEIHQGARLHRTVKMRYYTLERDEATDREVDPYGLMIHEGAFYMVGYCHFRKAIRTFLVDRIRYAHMTEKKFEIPAGFSVKDHFKHAWNIIRDKVLVTVKVRFEKSVAPIILEGRWHESQILEKQSDGSVLFTARVAGWDEIKRWILTFGPLAKVLDPDVLKIAFIKDIQAMSALYPRSPKS